MWSGIKVDQFLVFINFFVKVKYRNILNLNYSYTLNICELPPFSVQMIFT